MRPLNKLLGFGAKNLATKIVTIVLALALVGWAVGWFEFQ